MVTLRQKNPEAAAMWAYDLNGDRTPDNVSAGSTKEAYFRCLDNPKHVFPKKICKMTSDRDGHNIGCIYCGPNAKVAFPGETDLFTVCPEAEKSWDHEQNTALGLDPLMLLKGSDKYAHFICKNGHDEFRRIKDYTRAPYCQICAHSLLINRPTTALFLNREENTEEDIKDYVVSDRKMLYLKCPHCDYTWEWSAVLWSENKYCPHCGYDGSEGSCERNAFVKEKYKIITFKDANPKMAAFWDYERNGKAKPESVPFKSNTSYAFQCDKGHSFSIEPYRLFDTEDNPMGCPYCEGRREWLEPGVNDLFTKVVETINYWDFERNEIDPHMCLPSAREDAHFHCEEGHNFIMRISEFAKDPHCPICREIEEQKKQELKRKQEEEKQAAKELRYSYENSFAYNKPEASKYWNYELNGDRTPENTTQNAGIPVYLNCCRGKHEPYPVAPVNVRNEPYGCPGCREEQLEALNQKNSLVLRVPVAEKMWDKERNTMALEDARAWMSDTAYFICDEGHSFPRGIRSFVEDQSCPICTRDVVANYPHMLKFWNHKENRKRGLDPNLTPASSDDYAAWRCKKCGYEWEALISSRKSSKGLCPCCEVRMVVVEGITDLLSMVPELKDSYDFEKNEREGIDYRTLSVASMDYVNWECPDCGYKWNTRVCSRVIKNEDGSYSARKCPVCTGKKRTISYGEQYPELKERFVEELNGCSLYDIISYEDAKKTYYWNCDICDEVYPSNVPNQVKALNTSSRGCPYCSGKAVLRENSFAALHPELMDEYDPENTIDPFEVTEFSSLYSKWICRNDSSHRWPASFRQRSNGHGLCPICKDYSCEIKFCEKYPQYEEWYDKEKNPRPFKALSLYCNDLLWWKCPEHGHLFPRRAYDIDRAGRMFCPYCENRILLTGFNDLATKRPDLLKFYDYKKNELPPEEVLISSWTPDTWWHCDEGHSFQRPVTEMCKTTSCNICNRKVVVAGINDAQFTYPEIVDVWDYDKNDCLPSEISDRSRDKYWFKCSEGHSYEAYLITMISNNFQCLVCNNILLVPGINTLIDTHPELCKEISPNEERNPSTLAKTATYSMMWRCEKCGGDYHYPVCDRELGDDDCPFCNNRYTKLGVNSLVDTHPDLAKEYSPTNDTPVERANKNTITKAKWICPACNGEYWYSVAERELDDDSCPYCSGERPLAGFNTLETVLDDIEEIWADSNERHYTELLPSYTQYADWNCTVCGGTYPKIVKEFVALHLKGEDDCPYCNNRKPLAGFNTLEIVLNDIDEIWADSNERHYTELLPLYTQYADWNCTVCGGSYPKSIKEFVELHLKGEDDCPYCNNRKPLAGFNTIDTVLDDIEEIWAKSNVKHYTEYLASSVCSVNWNCTVCGGTYPEDINIFIKKHLSGEDDCPFCNNRKPLAGFNTLETVLNDIDEVWSNTNNRHYTEFLPISRLSVEWKCTTCGGIYPDIIEDHIKKHLSGEDDCPFCNGRKPLAGFNTLKAANPPWFSEWSYQNNYLICDPDEILPDYGNDVWWECNRCHHDFKMSPKERGIYEKRHKTACPYCKGLRRKKRYFF